jgi:hypothetical protein
MAGSFAGCRRSFHSPQHRLSRACRGFGLSDFTPMAYVHQNGWTPATGQQVKSCTTIDQDLIDLFKSVVAEKATTYERLFVAPIGRNSLIKSRLIACWKALCAMNTPNGLADKNVIMGNRGAPSILFAFS